MPINNQTTAKIAKEYGFDLIGFAEAKDLNLETSRLAEWLNEGYHAGMDYMARNLEKRKDIKIILPSAKSVISLGLNYYTPEKHSEEKNKGKVSRYAWGKDYHLIIWEKLDSIISELKEEDSSFEAISFVDTGPVMDKAWAVRSGLGWQGKHTNVISKEIGSWFFIANIITNYEFQYSNPIEDFCGSCTACIDACPTKAIVNEYVVDSNKCISYLTIENKKDIPEEFKDHFDNWLFGCDICQDVCPWNIKFFQNTRIEDFFSYEGNKEIDCSEVMQLTKEKFDTRFEISPIKRAKLSGLKRNAEFLQKKFET
jgi:epoxyqueuosine reductase